MILEIIEHLFPNTVCQISERAYDEGFEKGKALGAEILMVKTGLVLEDVLAHRRQQLALASALAVARGGGQK